MQRVVTAEPSASPGTNLSAPTQAAHSATRREAEQKLADIERDFSQWASDFIKNRDLKKLELDRVQLETRTKEMQISKAYRRIFQYAVDALRAIIDAYNKKAGTNFTARLTDLPINLYLPDSLLCEIGTIQFGADVKWRAYVYANKPPATDNPPFFQIDIQHSHVSTSDGFRIEIRPPDFKISGYGGGVATTARIDTLHPLDSFQAPIRASVQKLVETQISSLPSQ